MVTSVTAVSDPTLTGTKRGHYDQHVADVPNPPGGLTITTNMQKRPKTIFATRHGQGICGPSRSEQRPIACQSRINTQKPQAKSIALRALVKIALAVPLISILACSAASCSAGERAPSSTPTPASPSAPRSLTPTSVNPSDVIDAANLTIQVAMAVVAIVTLLVAVGAFFGIRELREIRRAQNDLQTEITEVAALRVRLQLEVAQIQAQFETLVQVSHLFNEGQNLYRQNQYDKAITWYEQALRLQPDNVKILARIARCHTNQGRLVRSEHYLRRALAIDPQNAELIRAHATNLRYSEPQAAIAAATKAVDLDSKDYESWNYLGLLHRDAGDFESAIFAYEQSSLLKPSDPISIYFRTLVLWRQGNKEEARWRMEEAISLLDTAERVDAIKPMWAGAIRWASAYFDPKTESKTLREQTTQLLAHAGETRNRRALVGHILFVCSGAERRERRNIQWARVLTAEELDLYNQKDG